MGVLNTSITFVRQDLRFGEAVEAVVVSALLVGATVGSMLAGQVADGLGPRTASIFNSLPLAVVSSRAYILATWEDVHTLLVYLCAVGQGPVVGLTK